MHTYRAWSPCTTHHPIVPYCPFHVLPFSFSRWRWGSVVEGNKERKKNNDLMVWMTSNKPGRLTLAFLVYRAKSGQTRTGVAANGVDAVGVLAAHTWCCLAFVHVCSQYMTYTYACVHARTHAHAHAHPHTHTHTHHTHTNTLTKRYTVASTDATTMQGSL